jgi:hypothetical protein
MANYLLAYHGGGGMADSDEERGRIMAAWGQWFQQLGPALVDGGKPVGRSVTVDAGGSVSEGGGANPVSGYSVIQADTLEAATALARGCPVLLGGGTIEVAETFDAM